MGYYRALIPPDTELSKMAAQELIRQKFLDSQDVANRSYNEHNMLLNQAIVNALYQTHTSLL